MPFPAEQERKTREAMILASVHVGVPQGSVLGPAQFSTFANAFVLSVNNYKLHLYSNETVRSFSSAGHY